MSTQPAEDYTSPPLQIANRNKRFYIDAVIFQVEDELYQVPRSTFSTVSHVFRDMFALPQSGTEFAQGLSDRDPIVLRGVQKGAFEDVLDVLQSQCGGLQLKRSSSPRSTLYEPGIISLKLQRWTAVLELSRMWGMRSVHTTAHEHITRLFTSSLPGSNLGSKLITARKYALVDLFIIASREYVMKDRIPINHEEAMAIGLEYAFGLVALREERYERRLARALEPPIESGSSVQVPSTKSTKKSRAADLASKSQESSIDKSEVDLGVKRRFSVEIEELQREYDSFFAITSDK